MLSTSLHLLRPGKALLLGLYSLSNRKRKRINYWQKKPFLFLCVFCISLMLFCCAPLSFRAHPEFELRARKFNTLGLIPCDISVYEVLGLGLIEKRHDWFAASNENIVNAIKEDLINKHYNIKAITIDEEVKNELKEIYALYRTVNKSIQLHVYGPQLFPEKVKNFEYSLGSIEKILKRSGSDSLVFVYGLDRVSKGDGAAFLSVAVVDASGTIVWYCAKGIQSKNGLRDPESASELVQNILGSFPEAGR